MKIKIWKISIFYPRYTRGLVTCYEILLFRIEVSSPRKFWSSWTSICSQYSSEKGKVFIKETADFLNKLKDLHELLKEAILVAADVVELYSKKPNAEGLQVLCKQYDKFLYKKLHTEDMIKMMDFVIKKPLFEFNSKFYRQTSRSVVGNKL